MTQLSCRRSQISERSHKTRHANAVESFSGQLVSTSHSSQDGQGIWGALQLPTLASTEQGLLPSTGTRENLCDCKCMLELQSLLN